MVLVIVRIVDQLLIEVNVEWKLIVPSTATVVYFHLHLWYTPYPLWIGALDYCDLVNDEEYLVMSSIIYQLEILMYTVVCVMCTTPVNTRVKKTCFS